MLVSGVVGVLAAVYTYVSASDPEIILGTPSERFLKEPPDIGDVLRVGAAVAIACGFVTLVLANKIWGGGKDI